MKCIPPRGFELLDHPADLGFRAWAPALADLFAEAARALVSVLVDVDAISAHDTVSVTLSAEDLPALMFNWLAEILFLFDGTGWLCRDVCPELVCEGGAWRLDAQLSGQRYDAQGLEIKTYVKAVTFHQLKVEKQDGMWVAQVFLDI
jgi:SHS2 domain-containing protein